MLPPGIRTIRRLCRILALSVLLTSVAQAGPMGMEEDGSSDPLVLGGFDDDLTRLSTPLGIHTGAYWWSGALASSEPDDEDLITAMIDEPMGGGIEIPNWADGDSAINMHIRNMSRGGGGARCSIPEPSTVWIAVLGVVSIWARPRQGH